MISDLIFLSSIHQQPSSVSCSYDVHRKTERKRSKQSGVGSQVDNKSCARRQHLSINSSSMSMMVNALYTRPLKACWTTIASHTLMRRCGNLSTYNRSYVRTGLSIHHQWVWWVKHSIPSLWKLAEPQSPPILWWWEDVDVCQWMTGHLQEATFVYQFIIHYSLSMSMVISWCSLYQALDIALTYNTSLYVW